MGRRLASQNLSVFKNRFTSGQFSVSTPFCHQRSISNEGSPSSSDLAARWQFGLQKDEETALPGRGGRGGGS